MQGNIGFQIVFARLPGEMGHIRPCRKGFVVVAVGIGCQRRAGQTDLRHDKDCTECKPKRPPPYSDLIAFCHILHGFSPPVPG